MTSSFLTVNLLPPPGMSTILQPPSAGNVVIKNSAIQGTILHTSDHTEYHSREFAQMSDASTRTDG